MTTPEEAGTGTLDRESSPSGSALRSLGQGSSLAGHPADAHPSLPAEHAGALVLAELLPGAVHELNNSLFAILGLVELLAGDVDPATRTHDRLELIRASAIDVRDTIRALASILTAPVDQAAPASFDQAVREGIALVRRFALAKDVEVVAHFPRRELWVQGSASELRNASLVLVLAAVRAASPGQEVRVEVSGEDGWVTLRIGEVPVGGDSTGLDLARAVARRLGGEVDAGRNGSFLRLPAVREAAR